VFDEDWRLVYVTDELRRMMGGADGLAVWGLHYNGSTELAVKP
jgi:hypothetical protein